jgi:hypothetical protein
MRPHKELSLRISKVALTVGVLVFLGGCSSIRPHSSQSDAEHWADDQARAIRAAYPELGGASVERRLLDFCGYEELDEGVGTTNLAADVPLAVEQARALLRRIGEDFEDKGWEVWGEGDYSPAVAALDNRRLFPPDEDGHPSISLTYDATNGLLAMSITSACYGTE